MDGMSDIRNEIEQRLGVFARPGAKAAFGNADRLDSLMAAVYRALRNNDKAAAKRLMSDAAKEIDSSTPAYMVAEYKDLKSSMSRPGAKAAMAKTPIRVTDAEYAALAARDAVSQKILGDSQYQITPSDRAIRAAGDAAYKTALARHSAWDKAWRDAPNNAARAEVEERAKASEAGMRVYRGSRPGAKAAFGSKRTTAGALRKQLKAQGMTDAADLEWHGISASDPDSTPYWLHEDGSMEKIKASRPSSKAKFGADQIPFWLDALASQVVDQKDLAKKNAQSIADYVFKHGTEAQIKRFVQLADRVGLRVNMSRPGAKATAAKADDKTECADCETEQDKAGLKLMEKADKAVSDKIRTLIKEGKPQDQAVAIALDMKRRGEL